METYSVILKRKKTNLKLHFENTREIFPIHRTVYSRSTLSQGLSGNERLRISKVRWLISATQKIVIFFIVIILATFRVRANPNPNPEH